ncbi:HAD family hydrolase [Bacteroidota bacterium]
MNNSFQAIIFDLDDTLIVEWESAQISFIETISSLDISIDGNTFVKTIRDEARKIWYGLPTIKYCLRIGISSWEALWGDFTEEDKNLIKLKGLAQEYRHNSWRNALSKYGINDFDIAIKLSDDFKRIRNQKHILFADTMDCLKKLKNNYQIGLITNGAPDIQWKKINGGGLASYFDQIIISGEFGIGKPDASIFYEMLKKLDVEVPNALMIGDSIKTDIKGSNEIGLKNIWINRDNKENSSSDIQPDYEISSLKNISKIIQL